MESTVDFRCLYEGLGGPKNKRKRSDLEPQNDGMQVDEDEEAKWSKSRKVAVGTGKDERVFGKPTFDGVMAGKISGRKWKQAKSAPASSLNVTGRKSTLAERDRERQVRKAYLARKQELKEQIRSNKVEKRRLKEERLKRKKENELRSGTVLQKITNPKTLKKMSKKQRKLLRQVAD